ncbi:MAG: exodeoxyribonuclease V subunit alpha [Kofleriaceae bacterium]|nr:exodeoxyribonuclease V subunit alpha [Kofleriaceae bacterium]
MAALLDTLYAEGALSALDFHFAVSMGRIANEVNPDVLLAAALLSRQLGRGHVCLELDTLGPVALGLHGDTLTLPDSGAWIAAIRTSPLVSSGEDIAPLVIDSDNRLYLYRFWQHEQRVADYIKRAARSSGVVVDDETLLSGLNRFFPVDTSGASEGADFQRIAAVVAAQKKLCVISGGPGTGKTFTVVKILALLIEQALHAELPAPTITLVAPTGKAAARLVESIRASKAGLECSDVVRSAIPETASTLHRCLGSIGGSSTKFRHNQHHRLATDIMLVDEASMVDLGMMRRLVDALPEDARLILIGDMDQLASVDAGAILGDICNSGGKRGFSPSFQTRISKFAGSSSEGRPDEGVLAEADIGDCVVRLQKSYRFGSGSGIAVLATAINSGDSQAALAAIEKYPELSLVPSAPVGKLSTELRNSVIEGYGEYLQPATASEHLKRFDGYRVLCVRRTGSYGVGALNEMIEAALRQRGLLESQGPDDNYEGRPVMITANNYQLGLFNGDIGLVLRKDGRLRAHFLGVDGSLRTFSPGRLGRHDSVFAMSVHKSQGSEFRKVAIVLPETMNPIMTREVIYTAVTRAKESVEIHGSPEILARTIAERRVRSSGLRAALWGPAFTTGC